MKSALWSIAKYILAITLLIITLRLADADKIMGYLRRIPPLKLALAFTLVAVAQTISALRMRFFFHAAGFEINRKFSIILFYVGAFFNFLLPGGIGGDAYKIILARKRLDVTYAQGIRIMLGDRASGLCIVVMMMSSMLWMLDFSSVIPYVHPLIAAGVIVTLICYLLFSWWIMKLPPRAMLMSLPFSLCVQSLWICALLTIWSTLGNGSYAVEYVLLYCTSSITGLLPISVGGLGIKEMTYYEGAKQLQHFVHSGVDGNLGVAISLCMFFLSFVTSLPGILWLNKVEREGHS